MYIKSLNVHNFRNYIDEHIEFCPTTNVFYGDNAQGKTNLLEAIYLFSHGRSHRAYQDTELIRFGEEFFYNTLSFSDAKRDYTTSIRYGTDKKKQIKINNVPIKKLSLLMSYLNVVLFSPDDLDLVKGSPSVRRGFMDEAISQLYPKYLSDLIDYHKVLIQKNSLLKTLRINKKSNDAMLSVWNEQLSSLGVDIYKKRYEFLEKINEFSKDIHMDIAKEDFLITFLPGIKLEYESITKEKYYDILEKNQKREIEQGSSLIGASRDDFKILINNNDSKIFASQGQQRTCVLTLKIAQTEYVKYIKEEYPVLLLDDIMSELDINRRGYLWERITDKQVIMTCTDTDILQSTKNTRLFNIANGKILI